MGVLINVLQKQVPQGFQDEAESKEDTLDKGEGCVRAWLGGLLQVFCDTPSAGVPAVRGKGNGG